MKRLNTRFLLIVMGCLLISGIGIFGLHHFQVQRQAIHFLQRGRELRQEVTIPKDSSADSFVLNEEQIKQIGKLNEAYTNYLRLVPDDHEARAEFAEVLYDLGKFTRFPSYYQRAYRNLAAVLRSDQDRDDIRRLLIDQSKTLADSYRNSGEVDEATRSFQSVQTNANHLYDHGGQDDPQLKMDLADAALGLDNIASAEKWLDMLITEHKEEVPPIAYQRLAEIYVKEFKDHVRALQKLNELVKNVSQNESRSIEDQALGYVYRGNQLIMLGLSIAQSRDESLIRALLTSEDEQINSILAHSKSLSPDIDALRKHFSTETRQDRERHLSLAARILPVALWQFAWEVDVVEARELAPKLPAVAQLGGHTGIRLGKTDLNSFLVQLKLASQIVEQAIENHPTNVEFYILLAEIKLILGTQDPSQYVEMVNLYDEILEKPIRNVFKATLRFRLTSIYFEMLINIRTKAIQDFGFTEERVVDNIEKQISGLENLITSQTAGDELTRFQRIGFRPLLEILKAKRLLYVQQDYQLASARLKDVIYVKDAYTNIDRENILPQHIDVTAELAYCYIKLDQPDEALKVWETALLTDPTNAAYRRNYATALIQSGKMAEARNQYLSFLANRPEQVDDAIAYIRLLRDENLKLPPAEQKWSEVDRILDALERNVDHVDIAILRARVTQAKGEGIEKVQECLEKAVDRYPQEDAPRHFQIQLALQNQNLESADQLIAKATKERRDSPTLRFLQAQALSLRLHKQIPQSSEDVPNNTPRTEDVPDQLISETIAKIVELKEGTEDWTTADKEKLNFGLAQVLSGMQIFASHKQELSHLALQFLIDSAELRTDRPLAEQERIEQQILERALAAEDAAAIQERLDFLKKSKLPENPGWQAMLEFGQALKLLVESSTEHASDEDNGWMKSDERVDRALAHLEKALELRNQWTDIHIRAASIYKLRGETSEEINQYDLAYKKGERNPGLLLTLAELLSGEGKSDEANAYMQEYFRTSGSAQNNRSLALATKLAIIDGNFDQAFQLAKLSSEVGERSKDPVWSANFQIQFAIGARKAGNEQEAQNFLDRAQTVLDEAKQQELANPNYWILRVRLARLKEDDQQAQIAIDEAGKNVPEEEKIFTLARCHYVNGELELAEQEFLEAIESCEESEKLIVRLGTLRLAYVEQRRIDETIPLLNRIIEIAESEDVDVAYLIQARQELAFAQIQVDTENGHDIALALLKENEDLFENDPSVREVDKINNQRAKARLHALQYSDPEEREKAIALYEGLIKGGIALPGDDRYRLAFLYEGNDELVKACEVSKTLVDEGQQYLAYHIQLLMKMGDYDDADRWLNQLENRYPDSLPVHRLRAKNYYDLKDYDRLVELFKFVTDEKQHPAETMKEFWVWGVQMGELLISQLPVDEPKANKTREELLTVVENCYESLAGLDPSIRPSLAMFLSRQNRVSEAVDLIEKHQDTMDVDQLLAVINQSYISRMTKKDQDRLLELIKLTHLRQPNSVRIYATEASLHIIRNEIQQAAENYEKILELDANHDLTLNNLAMIEAVYRNQPQLGLKFINKAIEVAGEEPNYVDTLGIVHLAAENYPLAVAALEKVVQMEPTPSRRIHLAFAYLQAKRADLAENQYRAAVESGYYEGAIDEWDRTYLEALKRVFPNVEKAKKSTAMNKS